MSEKILGITVSAETAIAHYQAKIAALETELAEARKDSERLGWMEEDMRKCDEGVAIYFADGKFSFPYLVSMAGGFGGGVGEKSFSDLRAAIDAARGGWK